MSDIIEEHEVRGAVARLADRAGTAPLPGAAIVRAGARRRVRQRAGAAGALALAATLAVSVSVSAFSTDRGSQDPATETGISNAFTEQLGRTLEQGFPAGTHVNVRMLAGIDPSTRYERIDHFLVRITAKGRESDAVLKLSTEVSNPSPTAADLCPMGSPVGIDSTGCAARDLAGGGVVHGYQAHGSMTWNDRTGTADRNRAGKYRTLTILEGDVTRAGTFALMQVHAGTDSNDSGLTSATLSGALSDPRFLTYLDEWKAHPENDPYGLVLPKPQGAVVASGTVGTTPWSLAHFSLSTDTTQDGEPMRNCDQWTVLVDGKSDQTAGTTMCSDQPGAYIHIPPATSPDGSQGIDLTMHTTGPDGKPAAEVGSLLSGTALPGTVSVEATFDDGSPKLTARTIVIHGDSYFAIAKATTPGRATWKKATLHCLDASGKDLGELYFQSQAALPQPPVK